MCLRRHYYNVKPLEKWELPVGTPVGTPSGNSQWELPVGTPSGKPGSNDGSSIVLYSIVLNTQLCRCYNVSDYPKHSKYRDTKYNLQHPMSFTFCAVYPCMRCSVRA